MNSDCQNNSPTAQITRQSHPQSRQQFERLYLPVRRRIYNLAYGALRDENDAEDILQETLLRGWMHYDRYNPSCSFEAWLCQIAWNLCLTQFRRRKRRKTISLDSTKGLCDIPDMSSHPETQLLEHGISEPLQRAFQALPLVFQHIVLLAAEGYTYAEIAEKMDCPIGTVRSRLHRARNHVINALSEQGHEDGLNDSCLTLRLLLKEKEPSITYIR